jgi:hypothetical protein
MNTVVNCHSGQERIITMKTSSKNLGCIIIFLFVLLSEKSAFAQIDSARFLWSDGFMKKEYAATDDVDKAIDAIFSKCVIIGISKSNGGRIITFGVGDKNGRWSHRGPTWNEVGTIKELVIEDGGVDVAVEIVRKPNTVSIGFKVDDGDTVSPKILHDLIINKLPKDSTKKVP